MTARAATPYETFVGVEDQDERNEPYDSWLKEIYKVIHQLGVPETRAHIERMGVLD